MSSIKILIVYKIEKARLDAYDKKKL